MQQCLSDIVLAKLQYLVRMASIATLSIEQQRASVKGGKDENGRKVLLPNSTIHYIKIYVHTYVSLEIYAVCKVHVFIYSKGFQCQAQDDKWTDRLFSYLG